MRPLFDGLDREQFVVVLLNAKHRPIGAHVVSIGSLTASIVHPRETFKCAVAGNAEAILSATIIRVEVQNQVRKTSRSHKRLRECGDLLGIRLIDHVIVAGDNHFSFVAAGYWQKGKR